ncbi:MAG TPA: cytochrome c [Terriglobales bacterium]|nr:cytochrome c [Terriglobales bacterium]
MKRTTGFRYANWIYFGSCLILLVAAFSNLALGQSGAGAATFKSKCVLCHGADGSGNTPLGKQLQAANLGSKDVQKKTNAELHKIVHDGKTNMPPFGDQLSDAQINQVIKYVRSFAKSTK